VLVKKANVLKIAWGMVWLIEFVELLSVEVAGCLLKGLALTQ